MSDARWEIDTRLIHAGEPRPGIEGAVVLPIFQSANYEDAGKDDYDDIRYIRLNNTPNHEALAKKLAALEGADHLAPARGPRKLKRTRIAARIWRSEFIVYHKGIAEEEAHCLERARDGESLERICQVLAAGRSPERATELVGKILQSWIDDGLVAEISIPGS